MQHNPGQLIATKVLFGPYWVRLKEVWTLGSATTGQWSSIEAQQIGPYGALLGGGEER